MKFILLAAAAALFLTGNAAVADEPLVIRIAWAAVPGQLPAAPRPA